MLCAANRWRGFQLDDRAGRDRPSLVIEWVALLRESSPSVRRSGYVSSFSSCYSLYSVGRVDSVEKWRFRRPDRENRADSMPEKPCTSPQGGSLTDLSQPFRPHCGPACPLPNGLLLNDRPAYVHMIFRRFRVLSTFGAALSTIVDNLEQAFGSGVTWSQG